eukprot:7689726-Alexandrium_andersonii.AAC.1
MSASLVGSEMCIRDSLGSSRPPPLARAPRRSLPTSARSSRRSSPPSWELGDLEDAAVARGAGP